MKNLMMLTSKELQVLQDKIQQLLRGGMVGEPRKKHETTFGSKNE